MLSPPAERPRTRVCQKRQRVLYAAVSEERRAGANLQGVLSSVTPVFMSYLQPNQSAPALVEGARNKAVRRRQRPLKCLESTVS